MFKSLISILENTGYNLLSLLMRIYLFSIFFTSGNNKLNNLWQGDWQQTVDLFIDVHPVPYIPPEIAAIFGTSAEVIFAALLLMGLCTRFASLGLLAVTAVIELSFRFIDPQYITFEAHIMWGLLLAALLCKGAGAFSVDWLLFSKKSN